LWDGEPLLASVASGIAGDSYNWALLDLQEGCSWDTIVELPGHPPVTAAFSVVPDEPCIAWTSQPVQFIDLSQFADSGNWTIVLPDGETSGFPYVYGNSPIWTFSEPGSFDVTLTVVHSSGCSDTAVQTVCVLPDITLWFPDAFSPNGDGANDAFIVIGEGLLDYECHIYNRWNALVWSSSNIGESWNGTGANGQAAPVGVYVVQISARDTGGIITTKTEALRLIS
jgi:gliding motility-associated-like protein